MGDIPCLFTDTTSSVRRMQAMEQSRFSHGHGGSSLGILGAESYLDGNTLSIAQSLTELARQPAHGMAMGWTVRYDENFETSGTATPPILKARQAEVELDRNSERRRSNGAQAKKKPGGRSEEAEENQPAKKRTKRRSSDGDDGGNEAEKKARGRPRLDTKDESAADVGPTLCLSTNSPFPCCFWCSMCLQCQTSMILMSSSVVEHRFAWLKELTAIEKRQLLPR